jgi:CRP-like cAMP-binding protein
LKKLSGLRHVPPAELAAIALLGREHAYDRGAVIWQPGARVDRVHIVVDGQVRVRGGEHGDELVGPEQTIGLLSLLARDDDGLDAVAEADTVTLALRADDLFDVFEDDFGILYGQLRDLAEQLLKLRRRIPDGTYLSPGQNAGEPPSGHIDLVQQLLFMRDGALRNANVDALLAIAQRMRTARFEPGATLWRVGEPSGFMYVLLSGRIRCTTEDGRHFVCGPGYPLGNLESQCDAPRWYEAVAETPVTAFLGETDAFLDTIEQHFDMALDFLGTMASGLIARRAEMRTDAGSTV